MLTDDDRRPAGRPRGLRRRRRAPTRRCAAGDDLPLLLLPVRLEAVYQVTGGATQLLLRVYPDDVHVDAHETELTDTERQAGTRGTATPLSAPRRTSRPWATRRGGSSSAGSVRPAPPGRLRPPGRAPRRRTPRAAVDAGRAHSTAARPVRVHRLRPTRRGDRRRATTSPGARGQADSPTPWRSDSHPATRTPSGSARLPWDPASRWLVSTSTRRSRSGWG